ncbi:MAG: hypothetical protein HZB26_20800 [Candidatus Hydrogenedentes bacterium]|nr:hypothetical protein [Candidatus Hydrogenedentota bacterium]
MDLLVCPHCGNHRIVHSKVPKDVVVVLPCPSCHELVVLYRNRVIALSREIIEHGTFDERKMHIAGIIAEFLEAGILPSPSGEGEEHGEADGEHFSDAGGPEVERQNGGMEPELSEAPARHGGKVSAPIRQSEVDHFVKFDLTRIDDAAYFKKHFG